MGYSMGQWNIHGKVGYFSQDVAEYLPEDELHNRL